MLLALLIGFFAGLRSLTAPAATAWAVRLGWLPLTGWLAYMGSLPAVALFTLLAVGELVADKLPNTPNRTSPPGLIGRILTGALCGACVAVAGGSAGLVGAVLGVVGALLGCFGGYAARTGVQRALRSPDLPIALLEDAIAIAGSFWVLAHVQFAAA
jgi:uncharacterized membrane protein